MAEIEAGTAGGVVMDTLAILTRDNEQHVSRQTIIAVAGWLRVWWRASRAVAAHPQVYDDKKGWIVNPEMKTLERAEKALAAKKYRDINTDGAVEELEKNATEEPINIEQTGGRGPQTDVTDPADLPGRGVSPPPVDRGPAVVLCNERAVPRKGRKPGVSKIPAHLRT